MSSRVTLSILVLAGTTLLAACSQPPQQRYQAAVEALEQAREARAQAAETVATREQALAELKQKLAKARQQLQQAKARVRQAKARIDEVVNDAVLFRAIQRVMLNAERFAGAAISVGVENRVVTLTGTVPDKATERAALEAARSFPGVRAVRDQLTIAAKPRGSGNPAT